jgi:hypothetical protein
VLGLCGAILGTALIALKGSFTDIVFQKWPSIVIIGGALLTVGYTFIAWLFKVRITMRDAFFSIVLLGLPWLSLSAGLYILVKSVPRGILPFMGILLFAWIWLVPILLGRNLCRGIGIIVPEAQTWRVRCSVIISITLLMGSFLIIYFFASVPDVPAAAP